MTKHNWKFYFDFNPLYINDKLYTFAPYRYKCLNCSDIGLNMYNDMLWIKSCNKIEYCEEHILKSIIE